MTELSELARANGMRLSPIKNDKGEEAVLIEVMDDMGDYFEQQDNAQIDAALSAGALQCRVGGVL